MTFDTPPAYLTKRYDLKHLTRREVLQQLADACLHRDWVLPLCVEKLPRSAFEDYEMRMVFGTIAGRWQRGAWDAETNLEYVAAVMAVTEVRSLDWFEMPRDRLVLEVNVEGWFWELDNWYCPWTVSPRYVEALFEALDEGESLFVDYVMGLKHLIEACPHAVDQTLLDLAYVRLRATITGSRAMRLANVAPQLPAPKPVTDWDRILERNHQ